MNKDKDKTRPRVVRKPWNDKEGRRLPIDQLRAVSQTWDGATWNAYLKTVESPLFEELPDDFDLVLREYEKRQTEVYEPDTREREETFQKVDDAIAQLSPPEKAIIQAVFWDGLSLRDLTHAYGISRNTMAKRYKKALRHLREKVIHPTPESEEMPNHTD